MIYVEKLEKNMFLNTDTFEQEELLSKSTHYFRL